MRAFRQMATGLCAEPNRPVAEVRRANFAGVDAAERGAA